MKLEELKKFIREIGTPQTPYDQQALHSVLRSAGFEPGDFYQELEMTSRYVDTHQDTSYSNASVSLHSHAFFEILYCRSTCGVEYLVGANRYRLQRGDIVVVHPGISHRPLLPEHLAEPYMRDVLWISMDFLKIMQDQFPEEQLYTFTGTQLLRTAGTKWEFLGDMFRRGVQETERKDVGWEPYVISNTMQLVIHLRRAILDKTTRPLKAEKPELLDQVLAYMEQHLEEKVVLADVARHFYVSESTITQTFRNKMGVSFHKCLTQRRLITAKALIEEGIPLESVGERIGFTEYSTFYRAFKQEYGISPRQYRKLQDNVKMAGP